MPLIIITGTPCSGKTYRAHQLLQEFESRINGTADRSDTNRSVVYIPSHHASLDPPLAGDSESGSLYQPPKQSENPRDQIYDLARFEKTARAEEFSAIKRLIDKNVVVIADAPNYIKGFRYQLFCEAKAAGTRSVVVHTAAGEDECRAWNNARLSAWKWQVNDDNDAEQAKRDGTLSTGPKVGKDVLGELDPESHTAVYGDRAILNTGSRSRSSSMEGGDLTSDDEKKPGRRQNQTEDTMTLKSLYITDKNHSTTQTSDAITPQQDNNTAPTPALYDLPSSTPPLSRSSLPYSPSTFTSLLMRYEPPSPFSRWDTPLFTIPSTDTHPPYTAIWSALFPVPSKASGKKGKSLPQNSHSHSVNASTVIAGPPVGSAPESDVAVKQHAATVLPTASAPDALQILESTTSEVARLVLAAARVAGAADGDGGEVTIVLPLIYGVETDDTEQTELELELVIPEGTSLSQPVLQRLRRKYTQVQRGGIAHGQGHAQGRKNVAEGFARFLQAEWE